MINATSIIPWVVWKHDNRSINRVLRKNCQYGYPAPKVELRVVWLENGVAFGLGRQNTKLFSDS
eukprot:6337270-Amphidinium_carterae.2